MVGGLDQCGRSCEGERETDSITVLEVEWKELVDRLDV